MASEWPVGPPHLFAGDKEAPAEAQFGVCECRKDRAIHSATFWAKERQIALLPPTGYLRWREQLETSLGPESSP